MGWEWAIENGKWEFVTIQRAYQSTELPSGVYHWFCDIAVKNVWDSSYSK